MRGTFFKPGSGTPGPKGDKGDTGTTGLQGPIGLTGATGAAGSQGPTGLTGSTGAAGTNGNTVLNGTSNPTSGIGSNGDFFLNTATSTLYGPKASGSWPGSGALLVGPQGSTGTNGNTLLNGTSNPGAGTGVNGDFFLNTATSTLYGPKAAGVWPGSGTSLIGPTGLTGTAGTSAAVYYNGTLQSAPKMYTASVTTASDSTFTLNTSAAGFTAVYSVHAEAITSNGTLGNVVGTSIYTFNTTTVTGIAYVQSLAVLGILGISLAGAGKTIVVTVIGK